MRASFLFTAAVIAAVLTVKAPVQAQEDSTLVFAAASLKNALDAAVDDYSRTTGKAISVSYAGSSALAKQIVEGAPADIFFSADLDWMDELEGQDLIDPASRVTLLGNDIVLVAPADSDISISIGPGFPLADALGEDKLAMALTESVPAGRYGKAALEKLGVWEGVAPKVAEAENVRAALALVSRGEAPLGIVYATDAKADPGVRIVDTFPGDSHPPILYPVALIRTAKPEARAFLDYLVSPQARPLFEAQGFRVVASGS